MRELHCCTSQKPTCPDSLCNLTVSVAPWSEQREPKADDSRTGGLDGRLELTLSCGDVSQPRSHEVLSMDLVLYVHGAFTDFSFVMRHFLSGGHPASLEDMVCVSMVAVLCKHETTAEKIN